MKIDCSSSHPYRHDTNEPMNSPNVTWKLPQHQVLQSYLSCGAQRELKRSLCQRPQDLVLMKETPLLVKQILQELQLNEQRMAVVVMVITRRPTD